jgi:hypothetical protein
MEVPRGNFLIKMEDPEPSPLSGDVEIDDSGIDAKERSDAPGAPAFVLFMGFDIPPREFFPNMAEVPMGANIGSVADVLDGIKGLILPALCVAGLVTEVNMDPAEDADVETNAPYPPGGESDDVDADEAPGLGPPAIGSL